MKGPFSIWAFFGLTLWIDVFTHMIYRRKSKVLNPYRPLRSVSIIIPAHREENHIGSTITALSKEDYPIKNIIVVGDGDSGKMQRIVERLASRNGKLIYVKSPYVSKARKINFAIKEMKEMKQVLGEFVYVRDARVVGTPTCIERMIGYFDSKEVAAVTSYGRLSVPKGFLSRAYHYGKAWINEIGRFRKNAQEKRRAVFVICGASTMYRTSVLAELPMPCHTKTEDTYYTWLLQREGYMVRVADDATASAPDVDGKHIQGIMGQLKQAYRWSSGTIQCWYREIYNVNKNRRLFYTTVIPGFIESLMYSTAILFMPFFLVYAPELVAGLLIGDTVFSLVGTLILMPKKFFKTVLHYPEIFLFKILNSVVFLYAIVSVTFQMITGRTKQWTNEWRPPATSRS